MTHAFAKVGRKKSTKRDPHDQYETPEPVTAALLRHVRFDPGEIVDEPAAGTGRMAHVLRANGLRVRTADVQRGKDFLRRRSRMAQCCTNPPYKDGLDEAFVRQALALTDGVVAMLLLHRFLWSKRRRAFLTMNKPTTAIFYTERIHFLKRNGKPIDGQFFDHMWLVWNEPARRGRDTRMIFEGSTPQSHVLGFDGAPGLIR